MDRAHGGGRSESARAQPPRRDRAIAALSALAAASGGAVAWALVWFSRVGLLALVFGAAATVVSLVALALAFRATDRLAHMLGYAFAFVVLIWPVLFFVGFLGYLLTGKALGD